MIVEKFKKKKKIAAEDVDEEAVEVDDIIGWEITLSKASPETRNYVIEATVLDPAGDEHPIPCGCQSARYG